MDFYILIDEENSLKISPKVLEIMKAKDEEWYKFDKYYDSKFFKSGFGLAKVREYLAWIYQKSSYTYAQIIKNWNEFKTPEEFFTKIVVENSLFALQGAVFTSFRVLMLPIEIFDGFLYINR